MRFSMRIGGLRYDIECPTEQFYEQRGKAYECPQAEGDDEGACSIAVAEDELRASQYYDAGLTAFENEATYLLDKVARHCLDHNRMIIHGAAISHGGNGYLFVAPSGTGKTTHIGLWKKYLDDVQVINGDKPMLDFDDGITICGTPWNGKENFGGNLRAPLKAIVVIRQGKANSLERLDATGSVAALMRQCFHSIDKDCGPKVVGYIGRIVNNVPVFSLECDVSKEAFDASYNGLRALTACS